MITVHSARARTASLAFVAALACSSAERAHTDSIPHAPQPVAEPAPRTAAPGDTGCVLKGLWRLCSVEDRLERAGLAPRLLPDTLRHSFMRVPGRVVRLGDAELQLFLYADAAAAARDVAQLDTVRVAPPQMIIDWIAPPTLVTSNNLVGILLSTNPRQVERVRNALTAGLPPE